jgi:hypothetical protein
MRDFALKPNQPQALISPGLGRPNLPTGSKLGESGFTGPVSSGFGADLSRVSISPQARAIQTKLAAPEPNAWERALPIQPASKGAMAPAPEGRGAAKTPLRLGHDFSRISVHSDAGRTLQAKLAARPLNLPAKRMGEQLFGNDPIGDDLDAEDRAAVAHTSTVGGLFQNSFRGQDGPATGRAGNASEPAILRSLSGVSTSRIMRKCDCGGECPECQADTHGIGAMLQRKGKIGVGPPDDRYEQEASRIESQVMRMGDSADPEPVGATPAIQTRREDGVPDSESALSSEEEKTIEERRGGVPLPDSIRRTMEPRLGADFSSVRLHSGPESALLNERLHAHAFTYGSDIWIGERQSASNLPLMAHELTHVLQQSPHLMRSPRVSPVLAPVIRRKNDYYSLPNDFRTKGAGTRTHEFLMKEIAKENDNRGLLTEVNIPGGKKGVTAAFVSGESAVVGRADFYKASTTIGVKFVGDDPTPQYLDSAQDLAIAGPDPNPGLHRFDHAGNAAPVGKTGMPKFKAIKTCPGLAPPAICRMDSAPVEIGLGDLKPPDAGERRDGVSQLNSYIEGIKVTAGKVNQFATDKANAGKVDPPGTTWQPKPTKLDHLEIPAKHVYPSTAGNVLRVVRYVNGKPEFKAAPEPAYLYMVPDPDPVNKGIWIYEYVPVNRHYDVTELRKAQEKALKDLNDPIIEELKSSPQIIETKRKLGPPPAPPVSRRLQRKLTYDKLPEDWPKKFKDWQDHDAKPYLGSSSEKKSEALETLVEIKKRSLPDLNLPTDAEEATAGRDKIEHWNEHGAQYGWLRKTFGRAYTIFVDLYEKARDKFRSLLPKTPPRSVGEGAKGALIRIGIKILKYAAHLIIGQVANRLTTAFKEAAENLISELFGKEIADLEAQFQKVQQYITDFEELFKKNILAVVDQVAGEYSDFIDKIKDVVAAIKDIMQWVNILKRAEQVAACLFPEPGIGCLWGVLGGDLVEMIEAEIAQQCWFRRDVMFPILRAQKFLTTDLPNKIAKLIIDGLMALLPGRAKELIGHIGVDQPALTDEDACKDLADEEPDAAPAHIPPSMRGDGRATDAVANALLALYAKWGQPPGDPLHAVGKLLQVTGVSTDLPLDLEKINRIDRFLTDIHGNTKAILDFIESFEENASRKKITFEEIIDIAENQILQPTVIITTPAAPPGPTEKEPPQGIIIKRF